MTTHDALLADILAKPTDDLPRLVYADWLDENGQPERAEFIRVQVEIHRLMSWRVPHNGGTSTGSDPARMKRERLGELRRRERELWNTTPGHTFTGSPAQIDSRFRYKIDGSELENAPTGASDDTPQAVFRRGFVSEIRCTISDWCGGECHQCAGTGRSFPIDGPSIPCRRCGGSLVTGIGPEVVRRHPVERVVLTDREPWRLAEGNVDEEWQWYDAIQTAGAVHPESDLPAGVFVVLDLPQSSRGHKFANTRELALAALSAALIAWAKSQPHPARIHTSPVSVDFVTG